MLNKKQGIHLLLFLLHSACWTWYLPSSARSLLRYFMQSCSKSITCISPRSIIKCLTSTSYVLNFDLTWRLNINYLIPRPASQLCWLNRWAINEEQLLCVGTSRSQWTFVEMQVHKDTPSSFWLHAYPWTFQCSRSGRLRKKGPEFASSTFAGGHRYPPFH